MQHALWRRGYITNQKDTARARCRSFPALGHAQASVAGKGVRRMSVFSLSNLKKTWYYLQKNGIRNAVWAVLERIGQEQEVYTWQEPDEKTLSFQREHSASLRISIVVPAYRTKKEHLEAMLNSVSRQSYPHWELIVADAGGTAESVQAWAKKNGICLRKAADASNLAEWMDQSIMLCTLSENKGISANTNAGIELAAGDAVGLLDHDDLLTANALWEMADCLEKEKKRGKQKLVLFSDEDKCDGAASRFYEPNFKPDFDGELLLTNNYICHFTVIETAFLKELKLRSGFDGAQDYDLMLRAYAAGGQFVHVPKVLYHWRCHEASTASNPQSKRYAYEAGQRALEDYCLRKGWKATVSGLKHLGFYREDYEDSVFCQRPEIGIWAKPLPGGRDVFGIRHPKGFLVSGLYENDGSMRYAGLRKGYSGPMHRAALQQSAPAADLRSMEVCSALKERYAQTIAELKEACQGLSTAAQETKILQKSMEFCKEATAAGYGILWDPQA